MSYIFIKIVDRRFKYYLDKNGNWSGLIDHAKKHYDYLQLSSTLLNLRADNPKEKIDFIDLDK